jgi:hypothetical protein
MSDTPEQEALRAYQSAVDTIIDQGRSDFGDATFDEMSREVVDSIGEQNVVAVMVSIAECDAPQRVIEHLSANSDLAKKIGGMSPARRAAELGRIEARLMPDGAGAGAEPAWRSRARGGDRPRLTDDASDAQWEKAFKAKYPGGFIPPSARR